MKHKIKDAAAQQLAHKRWDKTGKRKRKQVGAQLKAARARKKAEKLSTGT